MASVSLAEIRVWMNTAVDQLEKSGLVELPLDREAYWTFMSEDAFNMAGEPKPVIGSLEDDVQDLRSEMESIAADEGSVIWHILLHLGGVVQLMAEEARTNVL